MCDQRITVYNYCDNYSIYIRLVLIYRVPIGVEEAFLKLLYNLSVESLRHLSLFYGV